MKSSLNKECEDNYEALKEEERNAKHRIKQSNKTQDILLFLIFMLFVASFYIE
jgi:hypothetical protein